MARLVCVKAAAHPARLMDVVASAFDSLELDWWSIVELLHAGERESSVSTANGETSETPGSMPLVPGNDWYVSQSCVSVVDKCRI